MKQKRIDMIYRFVEEVDRIHGTGHDTEPSYYSAIEELIKNVGGRDVHIVTQPRTRDGNKPDFVVHAGNMDTIGIIEAKSLDSDLDRAANSSQLERYLKTYPNFILTNYSEFRVYSKGKLIQTVDLLCDDDSYPDLLYEELVNMLDRFFAKRTTAEADVCHIAELLAGIARAELRPAIIDVYYKDLYARDIDGSIGSLLGARMDFEECVGGINAKDFVDMCVQTITYGLLDAKINHDDTKCVFDRFVAIDDIPESVGILHSLFKFVVADISFVDISDAIEDIVNVLNSRDPGEIMQRYYTKDYGKEWYTHFYETFLSQYDPEERKKRGAFYTPYQVVSYINRSIHSLLKTSFGKELGFADESIAVLDPAVGTMPFLTNSWQLAIDEKVVADGYGTRDDFIRSHIMKHFYGYELEMTPYVLSLLRTKAFFDDIGYKFALDKSIVRLANTLNLDDKCPRNVREVVTHYTDLGESFDKERKLACDAHRDGNVLVIMGNPPYSGFTSNEGMFDKEIKLYKDGVNVDRNGLEREVYIRHLSDDYVKFIRYAHKRIDDREEGGVIGYITNNSYLDGIVHRGMREELMKSFDEIYILDLHGGTRNSIVGDEGVFDITVGTAIAIFVKTSNNPNCKVYYKDFVGSRESKFEYLDVNDIVTTDWNEIDSCSPYYFFIPKDFSAKERYDGFVPMRYLFNSDKSLCLVTARDSMTVQYTKETMWDVVNDFCGMDKEIARQKYCLSVDTRDWKVSSAQKDVRDSGLDIDLIKPILYRPFDKRYTYYTGNSKGIMSSPCKRIMQHMIHDNIGMLVSRIEKSRSSVCHTYVCDTIADIHAIQNGAYLYPLYIYSDRGTEESNINSHVVGVLSAAYGVEPTPEDIFYYIYGILYSNPYREKYAEFLKIDFPKIPFTDDYDLFMKVGEIGKKLADLHLMKPEVFGKGCMAHGSGDNVVRKATYNNNDKRVEINNYMYFEPVSEEVWEYQIGGYKPAQKWLKDRAPKPSKGIVGHSLDWVEMDTYMGICNALEATIELQSELDVLYAEVENGDVLRCDIDHGRYVTRKGKIRKGKTVIGKTRKVDENVVDILGY